MLTISLRTSYGRAANILAIICPFIAAVLVVCLAAAFPVDGYAQTDRIKLYADQNFSDCTIQDDAGPITVYVAHETTNGTTGSRFRVATAPGVNLIYDSESVYQSFFFFGQMRTGIAIAYGYCISAQQFLIGEVHYIGAPGSDPCSPIEIRSDLLVSSDSVEVLDCAQEGVIHTLGNESSLYVNPDGTCGCNRPEISTSATSISFGAVTVGDTATATINIRNVGDVDLDVTDISYPYSGLSFDAAVPFSLAPGEIRPLVVEAHPVYEDSITGTFTITCSDPDRPQAYFGVEVEIVPLAMQTRLLSVTPELKLGEVVTANVIPDPGVHIERGFVYTRPTGSLTFADSFALVELPAGDFVTIIDGNAVTETGLDYYVRVENSGVFAVDPPGAPANFFSRAVQEPGPLSIEAGPTLGNNYVAGKAITVTAEMPPGTVFQDGLLFYRSGGQETFASIGLEYGPLGRPSASIPASAVGPTGVEYSVAVTTQTRILTHPSTKPAQRPNSIRVIVPDLIEPTTHPGKVYRLLSIPLEISAPITGVVTDDLGGPDPIRWRMFARSTLTSSYLELPNDTLFSFESGRGYWLITRDAHRIDTGPAEGLSLPTDQEFVRTLPQGYNLIGNPFAFDISWDSILVDGMTATEAELAGRVEPPVAYVAGTGYVTDTRVLKPFGGYWLNVMSSTGVTLSVSPHAAPITNSVLTKTEDTDTQLAITLYKDGSKNGVHAFAVVREGADANRDRFDRSAPPPPPESALRLAFAPTGLMIDARPPLGPDDEGHLWQLNAAEVTGADLHLQVALTNLADEFDVVLIDRLLGRAFDARATGTYEFISAAPGTGGASRFALAYGPHDFVEEVQRDLIARPENTLLYQNAPNPFNPSTTIRYDLADDAWVVLDIFDVRGGLVARLEQGQRDPGRYQLRWVGVDQNGARVSSGIYFARLRAGSETHTRKMILLK